MDKVEETKYKVGDLVQVVHDLYGIPKGSFGVICSVAPTYRLYINEESRRRMKYILFSVLIDGQMHRLVKKDIRLLRRHSAS